MKAMIFAAGLGTRLHPLTLNIPKALVEVSGTPMLGRVILKLKVAGIKQMIVNVHHFPALIKDYLHRNDNFGVDITISDESDQLLDTGGGLKKALDLLVGDEPVLVHNADILTDFPIEEMESRHLASGADVTLLVSDRKSSRHLLFNSSDRMVGWNNSKTGQIKPAGFQFTPDVRELAFGGVHILSQRALRALSVYEVNDNAFSIIPFYIDYCHQLNIQAYLPTAPYRWFDIGKPDTLKAARECGLAPLPYRTEL